MASYTPKKYVVPKNRVVEPIVSLSPDNFPEFGTTVNQKCSLNFKSQVVMAEEQRKKMLEASMYDSTNPQKMNHTQLVKEGWAVLPFQVPARSILITPYTSKNIEKLEIDTFLESLNYGT
jgi:hypothetical protein